jgi:hypothetical protein
MPASPAGAEREERAAVAPPQPVAQPASSGGPSLADRVAALEAELARIKSRLEL